MIACFFSTAAAKATSRGKQTGVTAGPGSRRPRGCTKARIRNARVVFGHRQRDRQRLKGAFIPMHAAVGKRDGVDLRRNSTTFNNAFGLIPDPAHSSQPWSSGTPSGA